MVDYDAIVHGRTVAQVINIKIQATSGKSESNFVFEENWMFEEQTGRSNSAVKFFMF